MMESVSSKWISVFFTMSFIQIGFGHKILMNAILGEGSHFLCAASVGERLVEQGHNVTFLISNAYAHRATDPKFSQLFEFVIFRHPIPVQKVHEQFNAFNERAFMPASAQIWTLAEVMRDGRANDCDALLSDLNIMDHFQSANYSVIISDISWLCPLIIAKRFNIPHIALSAVSSPCMVTALVGSDNSPAYVPQIFSGLSNKLNFKERVQNSIAQLFIILFGMYFRRPYDEIKVKHNIISDTSIEQLFAQSELFLVNSDFAVEFPCAIPPNVIPVGGLTTRPSNALPEELENFMQSSGENGVIVCTMGTYFTSVPIQVIKDFINAFARLPQKVIFQLQGTPTGFNLPPNVKTLPWLPQNDLLGHEKTRAFLYQGGNNGFYEALYHGVPIVVIPIHGDQYDTGAKVSAHRIGITIDKLTLTENKIHDALHDVITNETFQRNMDRLSGMFLDRPMLPSQKAAFWVDHIIKHGGAQYQVPIVNLNFIERNLVDVSIFFIACLAVLSVFLILIGRTCYRVIINVIHTMSKVKAD
ncbi:UDP-glucuronosyltransferase 2B23-like [Lytechinus pictus]|uniref:UDP-glucuronosyltransferase 2B23-like n=1 Tax=Lytechinus pictus TaxID=7653 RepID=UPI00240D80B3|nr:UDP-glucuronosyltransferase 2B23-like [Lytechinus pictus]